MKQNKFDFRLMASLGMPILWTYGSELGKLLSKTFVEALRDYGIYSEALDINDIDSISIIKTSIANKLKIICLDQMACLKLSDCNTKINIFFDNPYQLESKNISSQDLNEKLVKIHNSICNSKKTYAVTEKIREQIQLRHTQVIKLVPDIPIIKNKHKEEERDYIFYLADLKDIGYCDGIIEVLGVSNALIVIPDDQVIDQESSRTIEKITEFYLSAKIPKILFSIGDDFVSYPTIRVEDILAIGILNIRIRQSSNITPKALFPGDIICKQNSSSIEKEGVSELRKILKEEYLKKISIKLQKDMFVTKDDLKTWINKIFHLE